MKLLAALLSVLSLLVPSLVMAQSFVENAYVQLQAGQSSAGFSGLDFVNPTGTQFTSSPTSGDKIILGNVDKSDTSSVMSFTVGGSLSDAMSVSLSYLSLNKLSATGDANFGGAVTQKLNISGTGILAGLGTKLDMYAFYIEPKLEVGYSQLSADGTQGTNANSKFPQNTNSGFVSGISVTAAYPINAVMDVVGTLSYHNFGKVKTGTTGTPAPAGMNAGERLESSLAVTSIGIGVRYSF